MILLYGNIWELLSQINFCLTYPLKSHLHCQKEFKLLRYISHTPLMVKVKSYKHNCALPHNVFLVTTFSQKDWNLFVKNQRAWQESAKNTMVLGCQVLNVIMPMVCAQSHFSCVLCDAMDCSKPGSSVYGILQARILERAAVTSSRGSP